MAEGKEIAAEEAAVRTTAVGQHISSLRLNIIILGLWLCLFISSIDGTIVTTALFKISSSFDALDQSAWLVTTYLLTYNSFLMVTAKLSDVWGLKTVMLASNVIFLAFSMACGGAKTMVQLIIFRAFQGIGGSGLFSLTFVTIMKIIVPEKIAFYSGVISSVFAMSNLLGPLLGGIISDRSSWRWIFWMNGPIVATAMAILFFAMPSVEDGKTNKERLRSFDSIGGILSVGWPIPLLFALQEAGVRYEWSSGVIIGTLVTGIILFFLFGFYETWLSRNTNKEQIFPTRFLTNPSIGLILLCQFFVGFPFYVAFVQLPQRFQVVNFQSAERAGILLLAVSLLTPVGAMAASLAIKRVAVELVLISGTVLLALGLGLLSSLPVDSRIAPETYVYEVIVGVAMGIISPPFYMLITATVDEQDVAVATGALNMVRTLGGCIAIAICAAIHQDYLTGQLPKFLTPDQVQIVGESSANIARLPPNVRADIGKTYGRSYNRQFQVILGFCCLNFLISLLLAYVRKKQGIFGMTPEEAIEHKKTRAKAEKAKEPTGEGAEEAAVQGSERDSKERSRDEHGQTDGIMAVPKEGGKDIQV